MQAVKFRTKSSIRNRIIQQYQNHNTSHEVLRVFQFWEKVFDGKFAHFFELGGWYYDRYLKRLKRYQRLYSKQEADLMAKKDVVQWGFTLEGTITGEHGIGLQKKEYLIKQHKDNIPIMKLIKKSLDPNNIMNPGKIFDV